MMSEERDHEWLCHPEGTRCDGCRLLPNPARLMFYEKFGRVDPGDEVAWPTQLITGAPCIWERVKKLLDCAVVTESGLVIVFRWVEAVKRNLS